MEIRKGKVFFVVGHRTWGKSRTLQALMKRSRKRRIIIKKAEFFIRSMSNDDEPGKFSKFSKFSKFLNGLNPSRKPYLIAALCPKFDERSTNTNKPSTEKMLQQLRKKYKLFFFVLVHQWHEKGNDRISKSEIKKLKKFGEVKLHSANDKRDKANITRAQKLREYIENKL